MDVTSKCQTLSWWANWCGCWKNLICRGDYFHVNMLYIYVRAFWGVLLHEFGYSNGWVFVCLFVKSLLRDLNYFSAVAITAFQAGPQSYILHILRYWTWYLKIYKANNYTEENKKFIILKMVYKKYLKWWSNDISFKIVQSQIIKFSYHYLLFELHLVTDEGTQFTWIGCILSRL